MTDTQYKSESTEITTN